MSSLRLISFGYLHQPTDAADNPIPPAADRIEDVRTRLHDPAAARSNSILGLDGQHPMVQAETADCGQHSPGVRIPRALGPHRQDPRKGQPEMKCQQCGGGSAKVVKDPMFGDQMPLCGDCLHDRTTDSKSEGKYRVWGG